MLDLMWVVGTSPWITQGDGVGDFVLQFESLSYVGLGRHPACNRIRVIFGERVTSLRL